MSKRSIFFASLMLGALAAGCGPLLGNQPSVTRPAAGDFPNVFGTSGASTTPGATDAAGTAASGVPGTTAAPTPPPYDPFNDSQFAGIDAPTPFAPVFGLTVSSLQAGGSPEVATSFYQVPNELQVGEVDTLIEHATFHFEKLTIGMQIGGGKLEVGTPPKLTLPVAVRVEDTDGKESALLSVKSDSAISHIYIADMQVKVLYGSLAIISLGNAARASATQGAATLPHSAKITQSFAAGFVQLPSTPGNMRTRVIIKSVPDPTNRVTAQRIATSTLVITP
jgi:hypothetical protein